MRLPQSLLWPRPPQQQPPAQPKASRHSIVPPEVHMAQAFVLMTGVDPTSLFANQTPPVRKVPPSFGKAAEPAAKQGKRPLLARLRRRCLGLVAWAHGMWSRARRSLQA